MIRAVMVMNTLGKPRLTKFYDLQLNFLRGSLRRSSKNLCGACMLSYAADLICSRPENVSSFLKVEPIFGPDTRLAYKHYATLYFIFVFDSSENELAMLDLIQVFVETLDRCFKNVCELDIAFNYNKVHTILDEIILGGQVLETDSAEVMKAVDEISKLEAASNAITFVPKSVTGWRWNR